MDKVYYLSGNTIYTLDGEKVTEKLDTLKGTLYADLDKIYETIVISFKRRRIWCDYLITGDGKCVFIKTKKLYIYNLSFATVSGNIEELKETLKHTDRPVMTVSSYAMHKFIDKCFNGLAEAYTDTFPNLYTMYNDLTGENLDEEIRDAYTGGYNDFVQGKKMKKYAGVYVYDINSLYPYASVAYPLPYGKPTMQKDIPEKTDDIFYFVSINVLNGKIKDGYIPFVEVKCDYRYPLEGYVTEFYKNTVLTLSMYDFELLKKHYDVTYKVLDVIVFKAKKGIFDNYMRYYYEKKKTATGAERKYDKMMLNALTGRIGQRHKMMGMRLHYKDNKFWYDYIETERTKNLAYVAVAAAITSIGRYIIINAIQDNLEYCLYSDTDSLHSTKELDLPISDEMGDYKIEHYYDEIKYYGRRNYIGREKDDYKVQMAAITKEEQEVIRQELLQGKRTI